MKRKLLSVVAISLFLLASVTYAGSGDWAPISGNEHNMIVHGMVHVEGVDFSTGEYVLGSFGPKGNNDCRSVSEIAIDGTFYATIRGSESGQFISFKMIDKKSGDVIALSDTLTFTPDATIAISLK